MWIGQAWKGYETVTYMVTEGSGQVWKGCGTVTWMVTEGSVKHNSSVETSEVHVWCSNELVVCI
jgi:hypothetical protein